MALPCKYIPSSSGVEGQHFAKNHLANLIKIKKVTIDNCDKLSTPLEWWQHKGQTSMLDKEESDTSKEYVKHLSINYVPSTFMCMLTTNTKDIVIIPTFLYFNHMQLYISSTYSPHPFIQGFDLLYWYSSRMPSNLNFNTMNENNNQKGIRVNITVL